MAGNLSVAIARSGLSRAKLAVKARIKPAQLSRQLSGDVNLTLDSIGRICEAVGLEFDVLYRKAEAPVAVQEWQQRFVFVSSSLVKIAAFVKLTKRLNAGPLIQPLTADTELILDGSDLVFTGAPLKLRKIEGTGRWLT